MKGITILSTQGNAILYKSLFTGDESNFYFNYLQQQIKWKEESIKMFGKNILQPRLTAWYGDTGKAYTYSGITMEPQEWTEELLGIKQRIEPIAGTIFTSALLNLYRNGQDSMGWHRDNEKELGPHPIIASVSFGGARRFQFRNYKTKSELTTIELTAGSLLLMSGSTNDYWEHQLPKTKLPVTVRVNITFRVII